MFVATEPETAENSSAPGKIDWFLRLERGLSMTTLVVAAIVLFLGWGLGIGNVTTFGATFSAMVPSTSLLLLMASLLLLFQRAEARQSGSKPLARAVAAVIMAVVLGNLAISAVGYANGLDDLIWPQVPEFETARMSEATSLSFLLLGVCLWQSHAQTSDRRGLIGWASIGASMSLLALSVFAFNARSVSTAALFSTMSLPTAMAFLCLFTALLIREREHGWVAILLADSRGSASLRRVLPWTLGLPFVLATVTYYFKSIGLYDSTFQTSLLALGTALVVTTVLIREAKNTNLIDKQNTATKKRLATAHRREAELEEQRIVAELSVEAKTKFLANMSHEIRTPMNGILGFSELLLTEDMDESQRAKIALIHESGQNMLKLIDDILDLSKIDTGHLTMVPEEIDITHIADSCVRLFQVSAAKKQLQMDLVIEDDAPRFAFGDSLRTRQVITNILGNAIKFTDTGRITVTVSNRDGRAAVSVSDTGIGIPEQKLASVLGEFVQADNSTHRKYGGSGLGLHISKRLIELMGGKLELESVFGEGTTVTITLPLEDEMHSGESNVKALNRPSEDDGDQTWFGKRVGVAEDHDINQILVANMIERLGAEVTIFPDGAKAIEQITAAEAEGQPFDLILMDIQMPHMDGLTATRELRQRGFTPENLPILAMTANAMQSDVQECLDAGMQAHMAKPLTLKSLAENFDKWLGQRPTPEREPWRLQA